MDSFTDEFNCSYQKFLLDKEPVCKFCGKSPVVLGYCCHEAFEALQFLEEKKALVFLRSRGYDVLEKKGGGNAGGE